ncbi:MAG TPA: 30S ribosomal protein S2 [bacterium]|nr:30S ribosomal protein S2 [bacterium]
MVTFPTLRELLEAGVHFGHKKSRWHPKMSEYVFTTKAGVHVINLEKTEEKLKEAIDFISKEAALGKTFVFVGTKKQSSAIVKEAAEMCGMFYVNSRWLGGTLTNFESVKHAINRYKKQKEDLATNSENLPKSELSKLAKLVARGEKFFAGIAGLTRKPDILLLFGSYDEKNALHEATVEGVKTVAVTDTNADPTAVDYAIPANDDATKSVGVIAKLFANAINEAKPGEAKVEAKTDSATKESRESVGTK